MVYKRKDRGVGWQKHKQRTRKRLKYDLLQLEWWQNGMNASPNKSFLFLSAVISFVLLLLITILVKLLRLYLSIISCRAQPTQLLTNTLCLKTTRPVFSLLLWGDFLESFVFASLLIESLLSTMALRQTLFWNQVFFLLLLPIKNNKKRKQQQHVEVRGRLGLLKFLPRTGRQKWFKRIVVRREITYRRREETRDTISHIIFSSFLIPSDRHKKSGSRGTFWRENAFTSSPPRTPPGNKWEQVCVPTHSVFTGAQTKRL